MTRLVHWEEGMLMRVQNLQMMQQGLLERFEEVRRARGHYPYGVVEAEVARDALEKGKIGFVRLRVILRSGLEVNVPGECEIAALSVRDELAKSRSGETTILLGVPDYSAGHPNSFRVGEVPDPRVKYRYIPRGEVRLDENTGENKQAIHVRMLNARLLFEHEDRSGLECLPLVRVRRSGVATGSEFRVELVQTFVPPCLFLPPPGDVSEVGNRGSGATSLLADISLPHRLSEEVHLSVQKVEVARRLQSTRLQSQRLTMAALQGTQFHQWMRFLTLSRYAARLLTLEQSPYTSPFEMFLVLHEALSELEALRPRRGSSALKTRKEPVLKYDHEDAFSVFSRLRVRLDKALLDVGGVEFHDAVFALDPSGQNRLRASVGPQFFASDVSGWFLAVQSPLGIGELTSTMTNRQHFEMTDPASLDQGWGGLQLRHELDPPVGLPDAPDLHYFRVERSNDGVLQQLWERIQAVGELAISRNNPHLNLSNAIFTFYAILQPRTSDSANED